MTIFLPTLRSFVVLGTLYAEQHFSTMADNKVSLSIPHLFAEIVSKEAVRCGEAASCPPPLVSASVNLVPSEPVVHHPARRIGQRIVEASSWMEAPGTGASWMEAPGTGDGSSLKLPAKFRQKLESYCRLEPQYIAEQSGMHWSLVTCKSSGPGSDPAGSTQHCVDLELYAETGTPHWASLCSCGRPWVQRRPCVHVVMACLQRKVGPLRQGVRLAMRRLLT